jgi:hypothetical protein
VKKAADYRKHAAECRALARGTTVESERSQLIKMAETWDALARDREGYVERHPELTRQGQSDGREQE